MTTPETKQAAIPLGDADVYSFESDVDEISVWRGKLAAQLAALPPFLRVFDNAILKMTEWGLVAIGATFTVMISLEVASRYVFSFSIIFVNAASRFLLLWFFLVGAGFALRLGAHIGFELLLQILGPRIERIAKLLVRILCLVFSVQMLWAGLAALDQMSTQTDPGLDISLLWGFLAIPVGFALLIYHTLVLALVDARTSARKEIQP